MTLVGDPVWLADVLRAEGLNVIEHDGWKNRGHGDFKDLRGVLCHHTAGGGSNDWNIVQNGRPDLPGPLAQLVLERDGTYRVIAAGVCWHAGAGDWPGWPTNNANWHVIGIEAVNNGVGQEWPEVQLDAYYRGCAAILRKMELGKGSCVAHKEYSSQGKIDPAFINPNIHMNEFRDRVQGFIDAGATGGKTGGLEMAEAQEILNQETGSTKVGEFPGWPTRRHGAPEDLRFTQTDYAREIDRELNSVFDVKDAPAGDEGTLVGQVLALRKEVQELTKYIRGQAAEETTKK